MQNCLSKFIKDPDIEKLELALSRTNIFSILNITNNEIRHSNFLSWLLDPKGSHNLQDKFLKWFLKDIFSDARIEWTNEFLVDSVKTDDIEVLREYRHIDLLLVSKSFVIVIENKMWSQEHSKQLARYRDTIEKQFPDHDYAFVFLTPYGDEAESEEDSAIYINYSYSSIAAILNMIVDTYKESMTEKTKLYLNDYLSILQRNIMKEDDVITIAQEIYKNHKEAVDFIIEHKPDRAAELVEVFASVIQDLGYVPETQNKYYARFLTKKLHDIIPRTGHRGWRNNEAFLFEINYWGGKTVNLKCVVSPGEQEVREKIISALMRIEGAKEPKTQNWSIVHSHSYKLNIFDEKYEDDESAGAELNKILLGESDFIKRVEEEIIRELGG